MNIGHWRWTLGHWRRRLGWPGVAGAGLAALALVFYAGVVIPDRFAAARLRQQAAAAEAAARAGKTPEAQRPEVRLALFYQAFPERGTAPAWLEKIYAAGSAAGLLLDKGEYKLSPDPDHRLVRYEISLPVHGGYVQVRKFIQDVLAQIPTVALSDVDFRRAAIGDPNVDARIRFILYLREAA